MIDFIQSHSRTTRSLLRILTVQLFYFVMLLIRKMCPFSWPDGISYRTCRIFDPIGHAHANAYPQQQHTLRLGIERDSVVTRACLPLWLDTFRLAVNSSGRQAVCPLALWNQPKF